MYTYIIVNCMCVIKKLIYTFLEGNNPLSVFGIRLFYLLIYFPSLNWLIYKVTIF